MGSVLIHWRTAVVVSLLALAMFLVEGLEKKAYQKGHAQATAEITTDLKDSALRQMEEARKTEDLSRATFAREQSKIEKERQNAETTIADLRRELVRVQRYTQNLIAESGLSKADSPAAAPDEDAARCWQLFSESAARYAELAETADRQRNDLAEWQAYGREVAKMSEVAE